MIIWFTLTKTVAIYLYNTKFVSIYFHEVKLKPWRPKVEEIILHGQGLDLIPKYWMISTHKSIR